VEESLRTVRRRPLQSSSSSTRLLACAFRTLIARSSERTTWAPCLLRRDTALGLAGRTSDLRERESRQRNAPRAGVRDDVHRKVGMFYLTVPPLSLSLIFCSAALTSGQATHKHGSHRHSGTQSARHIQFARRLPTPHTGGTHAFVLCGLTQVTELQSSLEEVPCSSSLRAQPIRRAHSTRQQLRKHIAVADKSNAACDGAVLSALEEGRHSVPTIERRGHREIPERARHPADCCEEARAVILVPPASSCGPAAGASAPRALAALTGGSRPSGRR